MKNYEKYKERIKDYKDKNFCKDFVQPIITKKDNCGGMTCEYCRMLQMLWLMEEYEEPETDWSKVEVDTPILVRDIENGNWHRRYFAKFEDGTVYTWYDGKTSWTAEDSKDIWNWNYAKLAEGEDE